MANVVNDSPVRTALTEVVARGARPRFWLGLAGVALMLGLAGPFDTYEALTLIQRLAYWTVICVSTFWIGFLVSLSVAGFAEERGVHAVLAVGLGGAAAGLPITAAIACVDSIIFGSAFSDRVLVLLPYVIVISTIISALFEAADTQGVVAVSPVAVVEVPEWLNRLPPDIGRDLVLLQAQDHYVRVLTSEGENLLRMTLSEAENALGCYGLRVHRSWWVARHWIERMEYRRGASVLTLRDGTEVPVGRVYRAGLREALEHG